MSTVTPSDDVSSISPEGINLIKSFEGLRLHAYQDQVGIWTVGYGHTYGVKEGQVITEDDAEDMLRSDIQRFEAALNHQVRAPLQQNQYDALVSFIYNIGISAFKKSTLLRKLNSTDYEGAADELLRWDKAKGRKLKGLTNRRRKERELFKSPPLY